ncbi:MatE efflux family protein [Campylobacter iguaniorum]|uniref:MATE family efflux transporter n=1 Tax=Campylobacter iguaniorum TaxID=1244531 RepID=UPI0007C9C73B|nr:MATE family efflux transporter [Campylobacter iguaniorum]ANE35683.1 MatE efflux family protein [Campylobacter iguaniorum]
MNNLSLTRLATPIFFDMLLRTLTLIINTIMVAKVDVNLVGAMGAGNQIFNLFVTVFSFLSVGCSVVVAQSLGARNTNLASRAIHISLSFNAILGLVCTSAIYFHTHLALELLQIPSAVMQESYSYLHTLSIALFLEAVSIVIAAIVRVKNFAFHIMLISAFMNVLTIIGNAIALFGFFDLPNYSLAGVGVSVIFARVVGVILLAYVLVKAAKIHIHFGLFFKFSKDIIAKILKVGLPSAGENLLWIGQYMVAFSFVASMGEQSLSVQTIYFQISMFIFLAATAISIANEIIVGHLVGAMEFDKAYKKAFDSLKIGALITWSVLFIFYLSREEIMNTLNLTNELKAIMRPLFTLSLVLESGRAFNIIMVNSLRASGDAKFPFVMGVLFMWGVSLPLGYLLGIHLGYGIIGVWIGFCADEWARALANTLRWKSRKWQSKRLV